MVYVVSGSYAYDNVLVIKYFCITANIWCTYVQTYSNLSNPEYAYDNIIVTNLYVSLCRFDEIAGCCCTFSEAPAKWKKYYIQEVQKIYKEHERYD